jgi:hypothetical protein
MASPEDAAPDPEVPAPETATSGAGAVQPVRTRRWWHLSARPKLVVPDSERWLPAAAPRAPSSWMLREQRLTVQLLTALILVGGGAWAAGKWAYNEHAPEGQRYTPADLNVLANRPKNAAMEFHHSLCVLDFERAAELAFPTALPLVEERKLACDAGCLASRDKRTTTTETRGILIEAKGREARAEVECHRGGAVDKATYLVRLDGPRWRVVERISGS